MLRSRMQIRCFASGTLGVAPVTGHRSQASVLIGLEDDLLFNVCPIRTVQWYILGQIALLRQSDGGVTVVEENFSTRPNSSVVPGGAEVSHETVAPGIAEPEGLRTRRYV